MHSTQASSATDVRSDAQLIHAYAAGDAAAFDELLARHQGKVYATIFTVVKDRFLADDLFQETFIKIIRTLREGRYAEQGKFLPWALRVAHNLCMDHFRRTKTAPPVTLSDGTDLARLLGDEAATLPGSALEQRQTHAGLRTLVEALPPEQREVVALRIWDELSFKEIAAVTGVSINTALGRMRYALINLRKMMAAQGVVLR